MASLTSFKRDSKRFTTVEHASDSVQIGSSWSPQQGGAIHLSVCSSERHYTLVLTTSEALDLRQYLESASDYLSPIGLDCHGSPTASPGKVVRPMADYAKPSR